MRTYGEEIFKFEEHMERLKRSAEIVGMELPVGIPEIRVDRFPSRIKVTATPEGFEVEVRDLEIDEAVYDGIEVVFVEAERSNPEAKALPYDVCHDAHKLAEDAGCGEAVLVDRDGFVTEGAYSNVFWVKNGEVFTREDGVLPGITRGVVSELIPVSFGKVTPDELKDMDEIFITKTTTGVVPIGRSGPITKKLMQYFFDLDLKGQKR